jgi:hypothetical protein
VEKQSEPIKLHFIFKDLKTHSRMSKRSRGAENSGPFRAVKTMEEPAAGLV